MKDEGGGRKDEVLFHLARLFCLLPLISYVLSFVLQPSAFVLVPIAIGMICLAENATGLT
ncbi:hypothetical protein [Cognataquiflexum rubidum]|uniref:hypothetical protein n=1 Tax=Cognataquiflexum rubidum TaxID=2922273 RepID=UPI001F1390E4|nr:hypothetical protein [Cognataquiflexum rubidum]MCH6236825.1 hypothetical protein [Cognataquiflexum rubidum]